MRWEGQTRVLTMSASVPEPLPLFLCADSTHDGRKTSCGIAIPLRLRLEGGGRAICNEDVLLSATRKKQKVMGRGLGALRAHARSVGPRAARASSSEFRELRHECRPEVGLSQKMPGLAKPYFSTE